MDDLFFPTAAGRIHARVSGAGRTLLLMHSNGRSAYEFDDLAGALADRFRVVAWDMPGHGDSDRAQGYLSVGDLAALAVEVAQLAGQGSGKPIIGGASIGATVALAAGHFHPDRIAGIVPIELPISRAGAWWRDNWPLVETMFGVPEEDPALVAKRYRAVPPLFARRLRIDRHKAGSAAMMRVLWAGRTDADATRERIAGLRVPALFVNGDRGLATDAGGILADLNPAARVAVIADSGHFPQTDDPGAVADAVASMFAAPYEPERMAMDSMKDGFVTVGDRRVHYVETGDGAPLLLLHSGGASCRQYAATMPLFAAAGHRVIAWDMAGHGDTDALVRHLTMEEHAALLTGFADALSLDRYRLAGSSIGGYIAMAHALAAPARIERLAIVEAPLRSPAWYRDNWAGFEAMCALPDNSADELTGRFRAVTPDLVKRWNIDRNKAGSWTMVDIAWACRDFDAAGAYAGIAVPTTTIIGSRGPTVGERDRLAALRPDAPIVVLDDCGHFPMIDDPQGFVSAVLA